MPSNTPCAAWMRSMSVALMIGLKADNLRIALDSVGHHGGLDGGERVSRPSRSQARESPAC